MLMELESNYHGCWHQRWSAKYWLRSTGPKIVASRMPVDGGLDMPLDLPPGLLELSE